MGDTGDERAQLRQAVRLQQFALQQHLAGHVHRQEQQLGGVAARLHVGDDPFHFGHLVATGFDAEPQLLRLVHALAQRGEQRRALRRRRPLGQVAAAHRASVGRRQQRDRGRIGLEDRAVHHDHQGRVRQRVEHLVVEAALGLERRQDLRRPGFGRQLFADFAELQDQLAARRRRDAGVEHRVVVPVGDAVLGLVRRQRRLAKLADD